MAHKCKMNETIRAVGNVKTPTLRSMKSKPKELHNAQRTHSYERAVPKTASNRPNARTTPHPWQRKKPQRDLHDYVHKGLLPRTINARSRLGSPLTLGGTARVRPSVVLLRTRAWRLIVQPCQRPSLNEQDHTSKRSIQRCLGKVRFQEGHRMENGRGRECKSNDTIGGTTKGTCAIGNHERLADRCTSTAKRTCGHVECPWNACDGARETMVQPTWSTTLANH